jgi:hypothetical protein
MAANGNTAKINYVNVEMILPQGKNYDVVSGLFKGIVEREEGTFVLLHGVKESTSIVNIEFYNIMTIEIMEEEYKNLTFLEASDDDQKAAFGLLKKLHETLIKEGRGLKNDESVIDVKKYEEVSEEMLNGKKLNKAASSGTGVYKTPSSRFTPSKTVVGGFTKADTKVVPAPTTFGRNGTKKPTKEALALMEEKIDQVLAGEYNQPLPEAPGDTDEQDDEAWNTYGY